MTSRSPRRPVLIIILVTAVTAILAPAISEGTANHATVAQNRYSVAGTCQAIRSRTDGSAVGGGAGPFRMQAATLGVYLLYTPRGEYLADDGSGGTATVAGPGGSSEWQLDGDSTSGFTLHNVATGMSRQVSLQPTSGCAVYPETQVDAVGTPFSGPAPMSWVNGTIDAHVHVTAFEFLGGDWHCGRPWDPFGVPSALPDCKSVQQGTNGQVESFLDYGAPAHKHDTVGWPTFKDWPSPTDLAEEGTYYTGMKRAWMAGLRVMVTQLVDNEALCLLMSQRRNPCNDMQSVRIQARDLRELQDYIDAQSGGPGKGFFRIVSNPFQARQVINEGKLAVVEGIEVSHLFDCGEYLGTPQCSEAQVDAGLQEARKLGVSTFFPIHKFDNAFGGTKMDGGETGVLVNHGNHLETGHYWNIETCKGSEHDSEQITAPPAGGLALLLNGSVGQTLGGGGAAPAYPPPPHCNTRGLTSLGAYLINKMIQQHFIVELDHMDVKTADATLAILKARHYSGVISAHSWDSPQENPPIYKLGGFMTPITDSARSFVSQWKDSRKIRDSKYFFGDGFGYGADMNGLHSEPGPSNGAPITYPFKSFDGRVTFDREVWGQRTFDLNKDGVANYGLIPDWMYSMQLLGGRAMVGDMFKGAEAYLEMWERAYGVRSTNCRSSQGNFTGTGTKALRLGASYESLLYSLGQPSSRPGASYRYCVDGSPGANVAAVFDQAGNAVMFTSTARGYGGAVGIHPGSSAARLRGHATQRLRGLWLGPRLHGGARLLYGVNGGRVTYTGIAARSVVASGSALSAELHAAGVR